MEITELPHVVVTGDPGSGFHLRGPFLNSNAALDYIDSHTLDMSDEHWWIMPIQPVEQETEETPDKPHDSWCAKRMHGAAECTCSKS
jgi:hypothetical protein